MLRSLTALMLLAALAAQTFQQAVIVLDYYANTSAFAQRCENKARPQMHCNGKCQMMKKLREEEKKSDQNPGRRAEGKQQTLSSRSYFATLAFQAPACSSRFTALFLSGRPVDRAYSIFHPPALV